MTTPKIEYAYSEDGENYSETGCETYQEAAEECFGNMGPCEDGTRCFVGIINRANITSEFHESSVRAMLDTLSEEFHESEFGPWVNEYLEKIKPEHITELHGHLSNVLRGWAAKHGYEPNFWNVQHVKTFEYEIITPINRFKTLEPFVSHENKKDGPAHDFTWDRSKVDLNDEPSRTLLRDMIFMYLGEYDEKSERFKHAFQHSFIECQWRGGTEKDKNLDIDPDNVILVLPNVEKKGRRDETTDFPVTESGRVKEGRPGVPVPKVSLI